MLRRIAYALRSAQTRRRYHEILSRSNGSKIGVGTKINDPSHFFLGENSYINGGEFVTGPNSTISIGRDCLISYNVFMRTTMHNYKDASTLIRLQGDSEASITVEDDVWVGYGAMIASGVTLHRGCVVGMGAVVTKDVPEFAVVGGCLPE